MKNYQLTQQELQGLRIAHRQAKRLDKAKLADRIKAVYLLGCGWTPESVCEALLLDDNTVYRYFERYKESGIEGLGKDFYQGKDSFLTKREEALLDKHLQEQPAQTTKAVIAYIKEEFDVDYSMSGANALLKRLGYTYKKPRTIPGQVDIASQERFKRIYARIRKKMGSEDSLFFLDGVHPQHNSLPHYGWFKKGCEQTLKTNTQYHRINIQGAIDIDRLDVISHESGKLNEESSLDFLELLRKARPFGRLYLVLDNAGYYISHKFKAYAKSLGITLVPLPTYSPNLNLIERLWHKMQRDILYNRYYKTFDLFREAVRSFFHHLRYQKKELRSLMTERFETISV